MKNILSLITILALLLSACGQKADKNGASKSEFNKEEAVKNFSEQKTLVDKAKKDKKLKQKLREEIGLKTFNGEAVEITEAELWYEGQNIVRIDVRFYNGLPVGTKHWYIKDGNPLGLDVALFEQDKDASIKEKTIYSLLRNNSANSWIPGSEEVKIEKVKSENDAEWELLKGLAEKYKPKAE
jgi:hypothetical protein